MFCNYSCQSGFTRILILCYNFSPFGKFELQKNRQNYRGRNIPCSIFWKIVKKKLNPQKAQFLNVFGDIYQKRYFVRSWENSFIFFCTFLKNTPGYIEPSGHIVFYEILCSWCRWCRCCFLGSPGGWIKMITR